DHPNRDIKYFSGSGIYTKSFQVPDNLIAPDLQLNLDLGKVAVIAEVRLNGHDLGTLWNPPFLADITNQLKQGKNTLEITWVNLLTNRMIGDEQLPEDSERNPDGTLKSWPSWLQAGQASPTGRYTFTSWRLWKKDSSLQQSGLLGPVRIVPARVLTLPQK